MYKRGQVYGFINFCNASKFIYNFVLLVYNIIIKMASQMVDVIPFRWGKIESLHQKGFDACNIHILEGIEISKVQNV